MTELAALGLSIRSDGVVVATDRLKDFDRAGQKAETVAGSLARAATRLAGVMAAAFGVSALVGYADAWSDMQSRVGAAVKNMEAAPALMQRMVDLANASYSPLEQTVEVYTRNVGVLRDLGIAASGAADFTESLNHMLVITATRGERAASVQNALSKAMATGKLAGDGLETVLANGGRVAEALADELGTTVSGLRGMASQGKITGTVISQALLKSLEDVRAEAAEMPATIGDAFTRIRTNVTALVGTLDQAWGVSGGVAEQMLAMADGIRSSADMFLRLGNVVGTLVGPAFDLLSSNMEMVGQVSGIALAALAGFYAPAMIAGVWALAAAMGTGVVGAIKAVTLAMMANPLGLLIAGLVAAVTAAFMFRDQIKQAIGVDVVDVAKTAGNLLISVFQAAFKATALVWSNWPTIMADVTITAVNVALASLTKLLNESRTQFIQFLSWVSSLPLPGISQLSAGMAGVIANSGEFPAPKFDNPWQGTAKTVADEIGSSFNKDHIGEIASTLGEVWTNADGATGAMTGLMDSIGGGGGGGAGGVSGAAKSAKSALKDLADKAFDVAEGLRSAFQGIGSGIFDAFKKGGDVASSVLDMLMSKLEQFASSWLDNIVNNGIDALFGSLGSFGIGSGMRGTSSITGSSGGYFPGFDGGGYTGSGSRSGGLDGKGGFMAMLHPQETVYDHTRGQRPANQNRPINVQTNIINNAGVEVIENTVDDGQGGVRQEITLNRAVAQQIAKPGAANSAVRGVGRLVRR